MIQSTSYPSIFNDVIGPVMRGPSSSHCAASVRIGRLARDLMDADISKVEIEFDSGGSLATTHESQGTDMGLFGGLLGWDATEERLVESAVSLERAGIQPTIQIKDLDDPHPNTYRMKLHNAKGTHTLMATSIGGGMIEVIEIDGFQLSMAGDYFETLIYLQSDGEALVHYLRTNFDADEIHILVSDQAELIQIKAQQFLDDRILAQFAGRASIREIKRLSPVLPIRSRKDMQVPFANPSEMIEYNQDFDLPMWELALRYESARGDISTEDVFKRMSEIVDLMITSIHTGLEGTSYSDRILGFQSGHYKAAIESGSLMDAGILNRMILYTTSMMEVKSSMGVIVAAPTAGACGGLPGAVIAAAEDMGLSRQDMTKAMLAAGLLGVFIASQATFAAEVGGCQAETGSGAGMAAAALVTLAGGSTQQAVAAASMALQNVLGLICDPVANRVEVPCLGRNVMAASNALACTNMALAGYDPVIPLEEVLQAMDSVGKSIPCELRCTALGGLSMTKTSLSIQNALRVNRYDQP